MSTTSGEDHAAQFSGLDTLLDALENGKKLQAILTPEEKQAKNISEYPATSTLLGLRTSLGSVIETITFPGEFKSFSDDGQRLITYSDSDGNYRLFDAAGNELNTLNGEFRAFSDDGQRLITYSDTDGNSRLFDAAGNELNTLNGELIFPRSSRQ